MTDLQFLSADGTTTSFILRTDYIGAVLSTENLTVCDIYVKADPNKYADNFKKIAHSIGFLRQKAADYGLSMTSELISKPGNSKVNQVLAPPTNFLGTVNSATQITLNWTKSPNATGYIITRSTAADFSTTPTVTTVGDVATLVVTGLTTATKYYFRIQAIAAGIGSSGYVLDNKTTS